MTVDRRGERAGADFRRAVDEWGSSELDPRSFEGFERFRRRRLRNRRIAAGAVAATVTVVSVVLVTRAFGPVGGRPASGTRSHRSRDGTLCDRMVRRGETST